MPTAVEAVRDVMSDRTPAVLTRWQQRSLRATLGRRQLRALAAFRPTSVPSDGGPNQLLHASDGATMAEELDRLASIDADGIGLTIEQAARVDRPTGPWMVLHRDPAGWLEDYVGGLRLVWAEVRPLWTSARSRLEREAERIRVATANYAANEIVTQIEMPGRADEGELVLPSHTRSSGRLRVSSSLQLVPLLAAPPAGSWGDDYADRLLSVRYAIPADRGGGEAPAASSESLEALLGGLRAGILLALEQPRTAGQLAEALFLTPSGLTHHLSALQASQLVTRTREGRHVLVRRTARASALLAIYDRA